MEKIVTVHLSSVALSVDHKHRLVHVGIQVLAPVGQRWADDLLRRADVGVFSLYPTCVALLAWMLISTLS